MILIIRGKNARLLFTVRLPSLVSRPRVLSNYVKRGAPNIGVLTIKLY